MSDGANKMRGGSDPASSRDSGAEVGGRPKHPLFGNKAIEATLVPRAAGTITKSLVAQVGSVVAACGARAILAYADALKEEELSLLEEIGCEVFCVAKTPQEEKEREKKGTRFIHVPDVPLPRLGQVKIAVFVALTKGLVSRGDLVVCLSGFAASGTLDTLVVTEVGSEFEMLAPLGPEAEQSLDAGVEVIERVLEMATTLGNEGREGKAVGAIFVVGDADQVRSFSRPLILNPFRGHPEEERNVMNRGLEETIKELSTIDGAFIIRGDGVVENCGVLLKTAGQGESDLPQGLGARHHAAAGITSVTRATAVTVSESTGNVMVFRGGKAILEVEKIRLGRAPARGGDLRHE
ncbi:MAG: DNA integrity scanning protein DisA nucleotide-binding domain protein [Planctomycetota bacterium]